MKKIIYLLTTIVVLCLSVPLPSQAATTIDENGIFTTSGKTEPNANLTITVSKDEVIDSESLMYLNEFTSDEAGSYSVTYETKEPLSAENFIVKVNSEGKNIEIEELKVVENPAPGENPDEDDNNNPGGNNNAGGDNNSGGINNSGNSSNGGSDIQGDQQNGENLNGNNNGLPNTATLIGNYLLLGTILIIVGLLFSRKKKLNI